MAMGHISVSRERGAPPKNQIECKNRINSSCKLESYVRPVGSLSKLSLFPLLFSLTPSLSLSPSLVLCFFSFSHTLYLKLVWSSLLFLSCSSPSFSSQPGLQAPLAWLHLEKRPITSPIFTFILLVRQKESYAVSRAYEGSALYRQVKRSPPTFVERK